MTTSNAIPELTVQELHEQMEQGSAPKLLDVRRPDEHDLVNIGGRLVPLQELPSRLDELEDLRGEPFVVYCRSGARSGQAVQFLRQHGFDAKNLTGGVLAWAREIDPSLPTY